MFMATNNMDKWSAEKAKKLVEDSPFKRSYIAQAIGIETNTLTKILNGHSHPSYQTAILLAQTIGKEFGDFLSKPLKRAS